MIKIRNIATKAIPKIKIVEVGPRDGLQNEPKLITTAQKVSLIADLAKTGIPCIETTSFVSPKWVPQMGDASQVYESVKYLEGIVSLPVLVPNMIGLGKALKVGVKEIAVFAAASRLSYTL